MQSQKDKAILLVKDKTLDRFWSKVGITAHPDRCWEWLGGTYKEYGHFSITYAPQKDIPVRANRIMYYLHYGIHPENKIVCHRCDNPKCVNPSHLFLGTNKDNTQDMIKKGRKFITRGTDKECTWVKLTKEKVIELREMSKHSDFNYTHIAKEMGLDTKTVWNAINKVSWKHI